MSRYFSRLNDTLDHGLEFKIEDAIAALAERMPEKAFKTSVAGTSPLWIPTYSAVRVGVTAASFAGMPFTLAYQRGGGVTAHVAKLATAPIASAVFGSLGAVTGGVFGVSNGVKMLIKVIHS